MSPRIRLLVFLLACVCLVPAVFHVADRMPVFGAHPLPYGDAINAAGTRERHVTNMVSAVNFDYRGFDTLGEEFMLLCAVTGTTMLLRGSRGEHITARPGQVEGRPIPARSDAIVLICRMLAGLTVLFGLYVALHAMTTPGGGFQGGVIVACGTMLFFLGEGYRGWRRLMRSEFLDACEGGGATLYALCGFASMAAGAPFLGNILPLGSARDVFSGGLMLVENAGVAFAVAGGFAVLFLEFLEETRIEQDGNGR
ncbi:MnhB domain-containing protein [Rhodopila sp.]|uniref:MnhB domain-containing protein n=1 Tax=Rhodopila sp. TaxID=2480087 RepID=UPI003D0B8360